MSNVPTTTLPLPEALNGVVLSDSERAFLAWLAGFEVHTVENIAAAHSRPTDLVDSQSRSTDKIGHEGV